MQVKLTQAARRRRIGKAHVVAAMNNAGAPELIPAADEHDEKQLWIGPDDRGVVLEVIGIQLLDCLPIIHVMPYAYRRSQP